ncbi:hypothetical protein EAF04_000045 [Stromatinia cepivora]|nr:hypothetical protein EAF04_000045 [Stromatinia cepivora]
MLSHTGDLITSSASSIRQIGSALRHNGICHPDTFKVRTMEKSGYCANLVSSMVGVAYDCTTPDFHWRNYLQENHSFTIGTPNATDELKDLPHLRRIYLTTFVLGAALHNIVLLSVLLSSDPAVYISSVYYFRAPKLPFSQILEISGVWAEQTADVGKAVVFLLLANLATGPGAALVGCWYWWEMQMARTSA